MRLSAVALVWALLVPLFLELRVYLQGPGSEQREHFQNLQGSGLMRGLTSQPDGSLALQIWPVSLAKCQKEVVRRE